MVLLSLTQKIVIGVIDFGLGVFYGCTHRKIELDFILYCALVYIISLIVIAMPI